MSKENKTNSSEILTKSIQNLSIDSLKELLAGAEVTIKINFPKKEE